MGGGSGPIRCHFGRRAFCRPQKSAPGRSARGHWRKCQRRPSDPGGGHSLPRPQGRDSAGVRWRVRRRAPGLRLLGRGMGVGPDPLPVEAGAAQGHSGRRPIPWPKLIQRPASTTSMHKHARIALRIASALIVVHGEFFPPRPRIRRVPNLGDLEPGLSKLLGRVLQSREKILERKRTPGDKRIETCGRGPPRCIGSARANTPPGLRTRSTSFSEARYSPSPRMPRILSSAVGRG